MNILLMTSMFPPIRTGSSFYAEDLAFALKRNGHEIAVVTLKNKEASPDQYVFPVHRFPAIYLGNLFNNYFKHFRICSIYPGNYKRLRKLIQRYKPDIIILVSHYHDIGFLAVTASRRHAIPIVCTINTQLQLLAPLPRRIMRFLDCLICGRMILPSCSGIISLDTEIERYVFEAYPKNIANKSKIIPYGIHGNMEDFLRYNRDYRLHGQVIGVGAVIQQRNFLSSITLFSRLLNEFPELRFKIIGHLYYNEALNLAAKLGIRDRVIFTGELPRDEVLEEIRSRDLYLGIVSGEYVGLGSATIEAMLLGLPVVSNAPPGLLGEPPLVDMRDYVFADPRRLDLAVEKTAKLLRDKGLRETMGRKGREFVMQNLNWDFVSAKMDSYLKCVVGEADRRLREKKGA